MNKYREKPEELEALAFTPAKDAKAGDKFIWGDAKKNEHAVLFKDTLGFHFVLNGKRANPGDYVVRHADESVEVVTKKLFEATFEHVVAAKK